MSLRNQVAIITGGGTGIGFGIAEVLAERGTKLAIAQPSLEVAQRAVEKLKHTESFAVSVELQRPETIYPMVESVLARFGRIDILVNNAALTGRTAVAPFLDCPPAKVDEIVDVNLKGTFYCSQAVAKHLLSAGRPGNIIHVSSVGAFAAQERASLYCATKAALTSLAQTMALELAPHHIRVNCVAPGDILTEASATIGEFKGQAGASNQYARVTPLGRRGSPRDIGQAVAWLASDEAAFVTGTTLVVDGGFLTY